MWRLLLFGAILSTVAATKLEKCRTGALPLDFRSTTCNDTICTISISSLVGFELDARVPNDTIHVFPSVSLLFKLPEGHKGVVPVEIDMKRGCNYLVSHSCPLTKNDIVTWSFDWDFLPDEVFGEGVTCRAEIHLNDKNGDIVTCFIVNVVIVE